MKIYNYMIGALTAMTLFACSESSLDDLQGTYKAPEEVTVTAAADQGVEKDGKTKRLYNVSFSTANGDVLTMQFVGDGYFLHEAAFTPAAAADAKKGNYVLGKSFYTRKGGGLAVMVTRGILTVGKAEDNYTISGSLWLEDGNVIRVSGGGVIEYVPTDPVEVPILKSATNNYDGTITMVFTTGGYTETLNMTTYQMEYDGTGYDLQVTIYSADGKLHPGTYEPGTGYKAGCQEEMEYWGQKYLVDAGTIWYTIENGQKTPLYIANGKIEVVKTGPTYTVTLDQGKGGILVQYDGPIADLDESGDVEAYTLTSALSASSYAGYGVPILDVVLANGDLAFSAETYSYTGNGDYVQFEIYSADGSLEPGEYTIATDDASFQPGTFRCGYDGMWGASGTFYNHVTDGAAPAPTYITEGTLTVTGAAGTARTFTLIAGNKVFKGTVDLTAFGL